MRRLVVAVLGLPAVACSDSSATTSPTMPTAIPLESTTAPPTAPPTTTTPPTTPAAATTLPPFSAERSRPAQLPRPVLRRANPDARRAIDALRPDHVLPGRGQSEPQRRDLQRRLDDGRDAVAGGLVQRLRVGLRPRLPHPRGRHQPALRRRSKEARGLVDPDSVLIPEYFALGPTGFEFSFHELEVGPAVVGAPTVSVPYDAIGVYLNPSWEA